MTIEAKQEIENVKHTYAYYPGCSLHSTAREYNVSTLAVCQTLGIELRELSDWICCGASSAHSTSHLLSLALPAHILKLAGENSLPLAVPCAMCFSRLKFTIHELKDKNILDLVSRTIGQRPDDSVVVEHLLQVLAHDDISFPIQRSLAGLKVACYYGCLLVRPQSVVDFDDEENPQIMDRLLMQMDAENIDWGLKTACCGASMPFARPDIVKKLSRRILSHAKESGADCVAVACPMCHSNLDMYQEKKTSLPIFYFTQLIGLALGFRPEEMLLDKHITDPLPLLRTKGLT
ncbi:CoB--CoM heterodisulfide reductase iron-sulfur subunit B family protein [Chloroflexota bacterium]